MNFPRLAGTVIPLGEEDEGDAMPLPGGVSFSCPLGLTFLTGVRAMLSCTTC